jgi:hypothetical protein
LGQKKQQFVNQTLSVWARGTGGDADDRARRSTRCFIVQEGCFGSPVLLLALGSARFAGKRSPSPFFIPFKLFSEGIKSMPPMAGTGRG